MLDQFQPMQDKHPIDDLFRASLANASIAPPAHLADAVLGAVQRRRRAAAWYFSRYTVGAALLLSLGVGSYWYSTQPTTAATAAGSVTEPAASNASSVSVSSAVATEGGHQHSTATNRPTGDDARGLVSSPPVHDARMQTASALPNSGVPADPHRSDDARNRPLPVEPVVDPRAASLAAGPIVEERVSLARMVLVPLRSNVLNGTPNGGPPQSAYVLPGADWWVGGHIAWYASRYRWNGGDPELSDALNKAEAWTSTIGIGLLGGRSWRSGFGLSSGLESERSEQAYLYTDRVVEQERVIATEMVTLNTTVYYSTADTIVTETEHEQVYKGIDRRTVWRVPLELSWQESLGRWVLGARCGVAAEFTSVRSSASLTVDEESGGVVAAPLSSGALRERYPADLVGVLGADLGILLHERWTLLASPLYMRGLVSLGDDATLHGSSERVGVRFQARFIF